MRAGRLTSAVCAIALIPAGCGSPVPVSPGLTVPIQASPASGAPGSSEGLQPSAQASPTAVTVPSSPAAAGWVRAGAKAIEQPTALTAVPTDGAGNPLGACGTCHPPIATIMADVAAGPAGLVAVGYVLPGFTGAAWRSTDGQRWSLTTAAFAGISMLASVAADDHGYIAVGRSGDGATAWRSTDGLVWTRAPGGGALATPQLRLAAVERWRGGFTAVGFAGSEFGSADAAFLTSPDGLAWTRAPETAGMRSARVVAVAAGGPGLVAVGSTGPFGSDGPAAAWTSADGVRWDRAPDQPVLHGIRLRAVAPQASGVALGASAAPGVVAVGESASGSLGAVMQSVDGRAWRRAPADVVLGRPGVQVRLYDVIGSARGIVVGGVVNEGIQYGVAAIWSSPDGTTWSLEPTTAALSDGEIEALAVSGDRLIGVGDRGAPDAYVATVWLSPAGWAP